MVIEEQTLVELDAAQLCAITQRLLGELRHQSALLQKLQFENALLKRMKFAAQSERFDPQQQSLLGDEIILPQLLHCTRGTWACSQASNCRMSRSASCAECGRGWADAVRRTRGSGLVCRSALPRSRCSAWWC
jgi:hypothetical protein